ncbi:MAG: AmmeMemoRadiSam system protein A [Spirochaetaceae bacterium]|jgi:AmmeMemoRadiSam system protein A|nr:AmmeMemoRadiSam system protein A [Spirochaetaceae bacterium]
MVFHLDGAEREALLRDAREVVAAALEGREPRFRREPGLEAAIREGRSALTAPCGAFVTLRRKGELRGCIGRMTAAEALEDTVRVMAREAAFSDPRFPPLAPGELEACDIEVSALSPLELCAEPASVRVGVHGLYLTHRGRAGVLLPQVPVEQGWDRDQFLDYICVKAGLPARSWEAPGARLYTFTALVFGEGDAPAP